MHTDTHAQIITRHIGKHLTATFTVAPGHMLVEWDPAVPKKLSQRQQTLYRAARDEAMQMLADRIGGSVMTLEVE